MRLSKFDQELQIRISEERPFDFAGRLGSIECSEMLTGEEVCDGSWGMHLGCRGLLPAELIERELVDIWLKTPVFAISLERLS
jgi:hypothetical protein